MRVGDCASSAFLEHRWWVRDRNYGKGCGMQSLSMQTAEGEVILFEGKVWTLAFQIPLEKHFLSQLVQF